MAIVSRIIEEFQHPAIQTENSAALWRNFSSNKSVPANMKKGFYKGHMPKNKKIGGIVIYIVADQNFERFSKIQDQI
jgi:hypothetical protein